jgi:hypothetical protein
MGWDLIGLSMYFYISIWNMSSHLSFSIASNVKKFIVHELDDLVCAEVRKTNSMGSGVVSLRLEVSSWSNENHITHCID